MAQRPQQVYRGTWAFYLWKYLYLVSGLVAGCSVLVAGLSALYSIVQGESGWYGLALLIIVPVGLITSINWLYSFPEIGLSQECLWFRHWFIWHSVRLVDIGLIDEAMGGEDEGLFVYSEKLPFTYRAITLNWPLRARPFPQPYRGRSGKALFIRPELKGYPELKQLLFQYRWRAQHRQSNAKRRTALLAFLKRRRS